jgi:serine/threonine protein kinase
MVLRALGGKHPNLVGDVAFSTIIDQGSRLIATMPLLEGDLAGAISWLRPRQKYTVCHGLICGIAFLHRSNVYHRDIKPENVLYNAEYEAKLIDFSLAKWISTPAAAEEDDRAGGRRKKDRKRKGKSAAHSGSVDRSTELLGTPGYISPEMLRKEIYTEKCDVYSAGVVFYEMMMGERLEAEKDKAAVRFLAEARETLDRERPLKDLIYGMLASWEAERPSSSQCIGHLAFFSRRELPNHMEAANGACERFDPVARFSRPPDGAPRAAAELRGLALALEYKEIPTVNAAIFYSLVLPPPHPLCALHLAAKLFEPLPFGLEDAAEEHESFCLRSQRAYENEILPLLGFDLLDTETLLRANAQVLDRIPSLP